MVIIIIKFSVPADFKENTLKKLKYINSLSENKKIVEVYGQITTGNILASGRNPQVLPQVDLNELKAYIKQCDKYGFEFNYTLNASCMGNKEFSADMRQFILTLDRIGVSSYTLSIPYLFDLIAEVLSENKIKASAICEINSVMKAKHYKELLITRIVVDPDITRRFDILRGICNEFGENVEIIVNNACIQNCPYKMFHYNHEAHGGLEHSNEINNQYYYHKCSLQKAQTDYNFIKINWIRPEDLHYYVETGITRFKIHGRNYINSDNLLKVTEAYFSEKFDGNLMDLLTLFQPYNAFQPYIDNKKLDGFIKRFYNYPHACNEICEACGHCLSYAKKSMDMEAVHTVNDYAKQLYKKI